jgi:hypothetical protein
VPDDGQWLQATAVLWKCAITAGATQQHTTVAVPKDTANKKAMVGFNIFTIRIKFTMKDLKSHHF